MAIPAISTPASAFTGPYSSVRNPILNSYIFDTGLLVPEQSALLSEKFGKTYTMTTLLDKIGAYKPVQAQEFSWATLDRTRVSATISSGFSNGVASDTWTLSTVADSTNLGYFLVGDVIRTESGRQLKVTAVGDDGGYQTITVARLDGSNIVTGDAADGETITRLSTAFSQGSNGPNGRLFLPDQDYNYTQLFRAGLKLSRDTASQKSYLNVNGKEYWYFKNEEIMFDEFYADQERALMFGIRSKSGSLTTSRGIWDSVVTQAAGQVVNFTTSTGIAESDFFTLIPALIRQGASQNLLLLGGSEAVSDIQQALKHYTVNGGVSFGNFGGNNVGLDIPSYNFMGTKIALQHYPLFDDAKTLAWTGTSTSTKTNFRHAAIILDLGNTSAGEANIQKCYRSGAEGMDAMMIHKLIPGMVGDSGMIAANSFDGWEVQILSEIGFKVINAHRFGAFVPTA